MDEKQKEELQPVIDAMRELPRDERVKAIAEFKAVGALGKNLLELSEQCEKQPGALSWTLMQVMHEGRRGFQVFVFDHEAGDYVWHSSASTLGEVALDVAAAVENRTIGGR